MKDKIKEMTATVKEKIILLIEKGRKYEIFQGIMQGLLIGAVLCASVFLITKVLDYLFNAAYSFLDRHFFGCASLMTGVAYLIYKHSEKKTLRAKQLLAEQKGQASYKKKFCEGFYENLGKLLYVNVCSVPNFSDFTSCQRPIRVQDMGNKKYDAYIDIEGNMCNRFALPKLSLEPVKVREVSSILQNILDQQVKVRGIPPVIPIGEENKYVFVTSIEDMSTYLLITFILDFEDVYLKQSRYEQAMSAALRESTGNATLDDYDYHG